MSKWSMGKKVGIGKKFGIGFGIVFTLLGGALGFYHFTVKSVTSDFHHLLATEVVTATHADDVAIDMLQLRGHEKEFLMRKDMQYSAQFASTYAKMRDTIEALSHIAQQSSDTKLADRTEEMLRLADTYANTFKQVVDAWVKLGLDQASGVQGAFRTAAQTLTDDMAQHQVDDLYRAMLLLVRWQTEFMMTRDDRYKDNVLATLKHYKLLLERNAYEEKAKEVQLRTLTQYSETFDKYLASLAAEDNNDATLQQRLSELIDLLEAILDQVFISDGAAQVLKVRDAEKTYLLHRDKKYVKATHNAILELRRHLTSSDMALDSSDVARIHSRNTNKSLSPSTNTKKPLMQS